MTPEERYTVIEALDYTHRRLQADIDDGSRPDQWSMEDIVRKCSAALAIMRGREPVALRHAWECNECGSQEYTMSVSEDDVQNLGCSNCGGGEWHKAIAED